MMQNGSEIFLLQLSSRKFVDVLEGVVTSPDTSPVVRERLMEVLAGAAFIYSSVRPVDKDGERDEFLKLWRRLKPDGQPDDGVPFDTDDPMFSPMITQPRVHHPQDIPGNRPRVIPVEEDIRRLFKECKIARGNAGLLSTALAFTNPSDFGQEELIHELYSKCKASQELIYTQIPWATGIAERSRAKLIYAVKDTRKI
ncbi:hypothetical protein BV22DRAFT_301234 [Leucogyrophana mollusca]|uniref:Uncharacterized protein n=1 Tax=Leucogyrophana mollusca TaxID=85980 RepID=A0ACB8BRJ9_9AGAM|nr:hypothetical protein BV22DRAFT_301234 [Leucogyrophana mollusca]